MQRDPSDISDRWNSSQGDAVRSPPDTVRPSVAASDSLIFVLLYHGGMSRLLGLQRRETPSISVLRFHQHSHPSYLWTLTWGFIVDLDFSGDMHV